MNGTKHCLHRLGEGSLRMTDRMRPSPTCLRKRSMGQNSGWVFIPNDYSCLLPALALSSYRSEMGGAVWLAAILSTFQRLENFRALGQWP